MGMPTVGRLVESRFHDVQTHIILLGKVREIGFIVLIRNVGHSYESRFNREAGSEHLGTLGQQLQ